MRINYGDTGLLVNYIQMFLKEYYSKFIDIEYEYSKGIQENLIKYINSPDSIEMIDLHSKLQEFEYNNQAITEYFKINDLIDEIKLVSKLSNSDGYPTTDNGAVVYLNNILISSALSDFLYNYGWFIKDISFRNLENKCEILVAKLNKNILPKSSVSDLINLYNTKYTEIMFGETDNSSKNKFSSLYNFEITKTFDKLCFPDYPDFNNFKIERQVSGNYDLLIDGEVAINNFRGLKTFVTNTYIKTGEFYAIYVKIPENYKLNPDSNNFYLFTCYSSDIGKKLNLENNNDNNIETVEVTTYAVSASDKYLCLLIKAKLPDEKKKYKICASIYDPDNEIDNILVYQFDKSQIKDITLNQMSADNSSMIIFPDDYEFMSTYFKINVITPEDYFNSPFAIHEKLLSYILEATVTEYSRESDIILIQKLASKLGYFYDETSYGTYDDNLKEFISNIQKSYPTKNGNAVEYGKGYTDPDTESILNSYIVNKLGDD